MRRAPLEMFLDAVPRRPENPQKETANMAEGSTPETSGSARPFKYYGNQGELTMIAPVIGLRHLLYALQPFAVHRG